jgi:hypothetical protein
MTEATLDHNGRDYCQYEHTTYQQERNIRSLFVSKICIDYCVFVCLCFSFLFFFFFFFVSVFIFIFYFYFLWFYISLLVFCIWELMRGKRDSPHQAGVFTRGEGIREFVMATKWLNTI